MLGVCKMKENFPEVYCSKCLTLHKEYDCPKCGEFTVPDIDNIGIDLAIGQGYFKTESN